MRWCRPACAPGLRRAAAIPGRRKRSATSTRGWCRAIKPLGRGSIPLPASVVQGSSGGCGRRWFPTKTGRGRFFAHHRPFDERTLAMNIGILVAACAAFLLCAVAGIRSAIAQEAKCEPQAIASKYPGLAGRTHKIGVSAADKPATFRDEKDPSIITGFDGEYARAAFGCIGVPIEYAVG